MPVQTNLQFEHSKLQPRSQGSLLPTPMGAGRREPWERGCQN